MMNTNKSMLLVVLLAFGSAAHADVLMSWGDGTLGTDYDWFLDNTLVILRGNGNNYKFWVHDGSGEPGTGVINNITVHQDATGDFSILIEHPEGYAGALDWNEGNLEYAGGTSTVTGVTVDGTLAAEDKSVVLDVLDGSIDVGGSVDTLTIEQWSSGFPAKIDVDGDVQVISVSGACSGAIFVGGDVCDLLHVELLFGDVHVDGNVVGWLIADGGLPLATAGIDVRGDVAPGGIIGVGSILLGQISVGGDCEGDMGLPWAGAGSYINVKGCGSTPHLLAFWTLEGTYWAR
jgi:hypothetical protein